MDRDGLRKTNDSTPRTRDERDPGTFRCRGRTMSNLFLKYRTASASRRNPKSSLSRPRVPSRDENRRHSRVLGTRCVQYRVLCCVVLGSLPFNCGQRLFRMLGRPRTSEGRTAEDKSPPHLSSCEFLAAWTAQAHPMTKARRPMSPLQCGRTPRRSRHLCEHVGL